ncbi:endonuclease/exonuclease/phosphatase family protein [Flagellimonas sp.]|uniref:endonuclease/exonuclease/phosphatase family protein n=1 Tax=Flagellimonas sp. TaxID=2058762 RepID=UPI003B596C94
MKDNKDSFSIMSFNARGFNKNGQIKIPHVDSLIIDFVEMQNPDILCFQECHYNMKNNNALSQYKYKFVNYSKANYPQKVIQAIYSKFPIIKVDSIYFPETSNGTIYADILMGKDTLRVYNVHLQSFKIIPRMKTFKKERSTKLMARIRNTMLKQYEQAKIIRENMEKCEYKKIIVGDFNSTQYSNIYRLIKGDFDDSFLERGKGFGRSYDLRGLPMRIDYILTDPAFEVISHQNFDEKLSDHYPVMATLRLKSEE